MRIFSKKDILDTLTIVWKKKMISYNNNMSITEEKKYENDNLGIIYKIIIYSTKEDILIWKYGI